MSFFSWFSDKVNNWAFFFLFTIFFISAAIKKSNYCWIFIVFNFLNIFFNFNIISFLIYSYCPVFPHSSMTWVVNDKDAINLATIFIYNLPIFFSKIDQKFINTIDDNISRFIFKNFSFKLHSLFEKVVNFIFFSEK